MKTVVKVLIVLLLLNKTAKTQNEDSEYEYTVSKSSKILAVSPLRVNVLYIGLDNPVEIAICDISFKRVFATIENGQIKKIEDGTWIVRVSSPGIAVIKVFAEYNGKKAYIGERVFRIKQIPDPTPMIAGFKGGYVDKNSIIAAPYLSGVLENFLFDGVRYTITGFEFSTLGQGGLLFTRNIRGNVLTPECIDKCITARSGQKLFFDNIQAMGPDGTIRRLPAMIFKLF